MTGLSRFYSEFTINDHTNIGKKQTHDIFACCCCYDLSIKETNQKSILITDTTTNLLRKTNSNFHTNDIPFAVIAKKNQLQNNNKFIFISSDMIYNAFFYINFQLESVSYRWRGFFA